MSAPVADLDTALTTIGSVKAYLRGGSLGQAHTDDGSEDGILNQIIPWASAAVSTYCGRVFTLTTHTETYDGDGTPYLWLNHFPITIPMAAGHGIWESQSGLFDASTKLSERTTTGGHYVIRPREDGQGCVQRYGGFGGLGNGGGAVWPIGVQNIQAIYEAGYEVIPDDIAGWTTRLVAFLFRRATRGLDISTSESMQAGGGSISMVEHTIPKDIKEGLNYWKRARVY